ncbi:hypothetical protein GF386_02500 [Candidatus Pacearchaeota archaeon]|nr:hypothetical protein [Candidatus Pacearchaeota archaeon]MBD3283014.1 hypothetical protein [Candidatus Pacearchaeota archaeon]
MRHKKSSWWPAILLLVVVIIFISIFIFAAYYHQKQSSPEIPNSKEKSENRCLELGCPKETIYVGSKNSDKYYSCECSWAKNIEPENLVCFKSDDEAIEDKRTKSEC